MTNETRASLKICIKFNAGPPLADVSGQERGRGDPFNWYQRGDVLPLASGVRRVEERPGEAAEGPGNGEHPAASCGVGSDARQADLAGGIPGKLLSPARRRACIEH